MKKILSMNPFFAVLFLTVFGLLFPPAVICQAEKLGIVKYTSPKGMDKLPGENVVGFSELNQTTGKFCIITLYGATAGTGSPQGDFKREWNNHVVKNMKAEANPKTDEEKDGDWTAVSGGSEVDSADLGKAAGFLTVISGFQTTVSVLAVFNDPACAGSVDQLVGSIQMDKATAPANNSASGAAPAKTPVASATPYVDSYGTLIIPLITRQLTLADLTGEWEEGSYESTAYYSTNTGHYVGNDRLAFRIKYTFSRTGGYTSEFHEVRNGKPLRDIATGTISISGRILTILNNKYKTTEKYVIRGWVELPDRTILRVAGPWNAIEEIPENIFTDPPDVYMNKAENWIRKKK